MSDNYKDRDIEKLIFGAVLADGAMEPSEKFWNKAYESILQRENSTNLKRASRWRTAFYAMGATTILLASYVIYMHSQVNDIKQQLATIENTRINITQQSITQTTVNTSTETTLAKSDIGSVAQAKNIQQANELTASTSTTNANPANTINKRTYSSHNTSSTKINSPAANEDSHANTLPLITNNSAATPTKENTTENILATNTPQVTGSSPTANNSGTITNGSTANTSNVPISATANEIATPSNRTPITTPQKTNNILPTAITQTAQATVTTKKTDSVAKALELDSVHSLYTPKKPITFAGILSKASVSAFYAPGITDDFLNDKNNDPTNAITAHVLKTQQDGDGTYALGLRLAYDISNKWTIQTGAYYSEYTYNINPTIIYPQQQENGQVEYSITTSSGTVFLPNSAVPAHLGDSIKVKGSSSRGYISIPLQVKYKFAESTHFSFYVDGGFAVNIANYKVTQIHWENTSLQEGDVTVQSIYGLNTVQYSYNIGFGAAYLIGKGLSIYTEPFMDGSFTSINKNTPVIIYPYFFGLAVGLTYHF